MTVQSSLTTADIGAMPSLLRDTRSALVLAEDRPGQPRATLAPRRVPQAERRPRRADPGRRLERLDGSTPPARSTRLATRRDVVVFDGFQVDLDTGQVVPEGQGGDVVFRVKGEGGPRLETVGGARLYTLAKAPTLDTPKAPQPTPGKTVLPGDFAGRYRLFANGQWSGTLDLKVEGRGVVTGQFRSDLHGTSYPVSGQVATDVASKILFAVKYPRARQEFEGYLWAEGKGAMAGIASIAERPIGFFAIREGGKYAPEGAEVGPLVADPADRPGRHVVEVHGDRIRFDGKPSTIDDMANGLKTLVEADASPAAWVLIRASGDQKFIDVLRVSEAVVSAGVKVVRFEPAEAGK